MAKEKEITLIDSDICTVASYVIYESIKYKVIRACYLKEINAAASEPKLKVQIYINNKKGLAKTLFIADFKDPHEWKPNLKLKKGDKISVYVTNRSNYSQDIYTSLILTKYK